MTHQQNEPIVYFPYQNIETLFIVAFDLLNKDGTTLTIKEISRLFGPEDSSSARAMEMFLAGVVRDSEHDGEINEELTRDEFKGLVCTEGTQMSSALEMFTVSLVAKQYVYLRNSLIVSSNCT